MLDKILVKEVVAPIIIILVFSLLYMIISKILKRMMNLRFYRVKDNRKKTLVALLNNIIKYFFMIVAILMILSVYGVDTKALVASLGVLGLVVGLALQDILKDFVSGFFIIFENQYGIGDTVKIGDFKGEIISIGLKTTRIKAFTGEIKILANRNIQEVVNYSFSKSLAIVNVVVRPDDDVQKIEEILNKLCLRLTNELPEILGDVVLLGITNLSPSGVEFRINVETKSLKNAEVERLIMKEVKIEFDKNNIDLPFNQVVNSNVGI